MCLFTHEMIIYVENLNQQKNLKLISDYSSVARYKISIQSYLLSHISGINKWNLMLKMQYHLH